MTSHTGMMTLFALCVATVFAALLRDQPDQQWRVGLRIFGAFVAGAYALGWLMYGLFG